MYASSFSTKPWRFASSRMKAFTSGRFWQAAACAGGLPAARPRRARGEQQAKRQGGEALHAQAQLAHHAPQPDHAGAPPRAP